MAVETQEAEQEKEVKNYGYHFETPEEFAIDVPEEKAVENVKEEASVPNEAVQPTPASSEAENKKEDVKPTSPEPVDWKESLKSQDKYDVLKALGYDDFTVNMLKYKDAEGDFSPYLKAKTVDYAKMDSNQIFLEQLKKENPGLSERALKFKLKDSLNDKYFLDRDMYPEESEEAEIGKELMDADAEKLRKSFVDEQQKFTAPDPVKQPVQQDFSKEIIKSVDEHPVSQAILKENKLTFGDGEESFHFPIDSKALLQKAENTFTGLNVRDLSKVDMNKFYMSLAISADLDAFQKAFADHYKNVGRKALQTELQNAKPPSGQPTTPEPELTPAQKLARSGRLI